MIGEKRLKYGAKKIKCARCYNDAIRERRAWVRIQTTVYGENGWAKYKVLDLCPSCENELKAWANIN